MDGGNDHDGDEGGGGGWVDCIEINAGQDKRFQTMLTKKWTSLSV